MNWELLVAGGSTLAALVVAFLWARAERRATFADSLKASLDNLKTTLKASEAVVVHKEEYIRELEKTVLGNLPAGQLANRLTLLFTANRSGAAGFVPTPAAGSKKARS
jgi:FtsZ-interacting cell division protein ZipA